MKTTGMPCKLVSCHDVTPVPERASHLSYSAIRKAPLVSSGQLYVAVTAFALLKRSQPDLRDHFRIVLRTLRHRPTRLHYHGTFTFSEINYITTVF